jgi:hypothetical protein
MGLGRAAGVLLVVLISGALIDGARGGDRVECEPQRVTGDGHYWAYRVIDGRECWYPGRPGKPKNELYWGRATTPSARQTVDQPEIETETETSEPPTLTSEPAPPSVAAPPEKPQIAEPVPAKWRATTRDQMLAFTCCWPELEEPARPPAWPLALLPLGFYPLWWIAKSRRGLRAVRAGDAGRVAARSLTRLHRHKGRDSIRERGEVSAIGLVRKRPSVRRNDEQLASCRQCSADLDENATSLFVLPVKEQRDVALASLVDAHDGRAGCANEPLGPLPLREMKENRRLVMMHEAGQGTEGLMSASDIARGATALNDND